MCVLKTGKQRAKFCWLIESPRPPRCQTKKREKQARERERGLRPTNQKRKDATTTTEHTLPSDSSQQAGSDRCLSSASRRHIQLTPSLDVVISHRRTTDRQVTQYSHWCFFPATFRGLFITYQQIVAHGATNDRRSGARTPTILNGRGRTPTNRQLDRYIAPHSTSRRRMTEAINKSINQSIHRSIDDRTND